MTLTTLEAKIWERLKVQTEHKFVDFDAKVAQISSTMAAEAANLAILCERADALCKGERGEGGPSVTDPGRQES